MAGLVAFALLAVVHHSGARAARVEPAKPRAEAAERVGPLRALVIHEARDERVLRAAHALERALTPDRTR